MFGELIMIAQYDDSNKIRSSTGVAASWMSPIGPMTFTFLKIYQKQIQINRKF